RVRDRGERRKEKEEGEGGRRGKRGEEGLLLPPPVMASGIVHQQRRERERERERLRERENGGRRGGNTLAANATLPLHHSATSNMALATSDEEDRARRRTSEAPRPHTVETSVTLTV
ncbi:hypothetical protein U1Q18_022622, partial [Sarracenia purpurea var. burkii]